MDEVVNDEKIVENPWTDPETGKFKPNNPGKPKGTKHKPKLVDLIAKAVVDKFKSEGKTIDDAVYEIARAIAEKILGGDINLMKEFWQQRDGKPKQPLTGGDEDDEPIKISFDNSFKDYDSTPRPTGDSEKQS